MNQTLKIGFVVSMSGRWPRELPEARAREYGDWLESHLSGCEIVRAEGLCDSPAATERVCARFAAEKVGVVVLVYGAFTGDDVAARLWETLGVPVVLWAPREPKWARDERMYANALVSATMNAAALRQLGAKYHVIYGDKDDPSVAREVTAWLAAYAAVTRMRGALLGLFGYRPTAFYNCAFDEKLIRKTFGVRIEETDLKAVTDVMASLPDADVRAEMERVRARFAGADDLPEGHLENHARLLLAIREVMARQGYDQAVLKCWPELGSLHMTPCAVIGRLADCGLHVACEGDVDAALTDMLQFALTGLPAFITDMINLDEADNTMTFWHCGNAAPSLESARYPLEIHNHPLAGQGTALWGALKSGRVTAARLCNIDGRYKLFLTTGEAVEDAPITRGVMATVRLDQPVLDVQRAIWREGVAHHYSLVWADCADALRRAAELLGIEVIGE